MSKRNLGNVLTRGAVVQATPMTFGTPEGFAQAFSYIPSPTSVIEFGCGSGPVLHWVIDNVKPARVLGVDILAVRHLLPASAEFLRADFHELPSVADNEFECGLAITSFRMSEWPRDAVAELCRVSRNSCIIVEGPNTDNAFKIGRVGEDDWEGLFAQHGMQLIKRFPTTPNGYFFMVFTR